MPQHIGYVIKRYLDAKGMQQNELAECIGVRQETVSRWVHAIGKPRPFNLQKIAKCLKMDVDTLVAEAEGHVKISGGGSPQVGGGVVFQTFTIDSGAITVRAKDGKLIVGIAN